MNLVTFPLLCLAVLIQQTICQDEAYNKHLCHHEDVKNSIVQKHNELRTQVKPSPTNMLKMIWNDEAAKNAKSWADKCLHGHSKPEDRRTSSFDCGENLYMSTRPHGWNKVMQGWWDEYKDFDYGVGAKKSGAVIGHYTQFVWYRSYQIGCALTYCPNQKVPYFYVCHYCPAGNAKSTLHSPYESGKACGKCEHECKNGLCENACEHDDRVEGCEEYEEHCHSEEEGVSEEHKMSYMCPGTCNCKEKIR